MSRVNALHCIMCDAPERECGCGELYVSFDEALMAVFGESTQIYDPVSACDMCIFAFSANCQPLRGWLRMWLEDRETVEDQQLAGCEDYRSHL